MTSDSRTAAVTVAASAEAVFAVLADPATHAAIDGTRWVCEPLDGEHLTREGQLFRMAMYHSGHPDGRYEVVNQVRVLDPPRAIAWATGTDETGTLEFGGWTWRYDVSPVGPVETTVTLTYDWSAVPPRIRAYLEFPPFTPGHLDDSVRRLAAMVVGETSPAVG